MSVAAVTQQQLEKQVGEFQNLQKEYSKAVSSRSTLEAQLKENEMVKKEFDNIKDDATVYKLIGPVLVKQDRPEAAANVNKRIEYISGEIKRLEAQIKSFEEKQEQKKMEIVKLQTAFEQLKQ
ncbi:Prefoldin beta-like protein [Rhizoclosmatium globosum]|uniref:Prefoldin beta-like protein n=1 Tax=Rhizoclosmatium globosum TaxID=329046 RepID=A0A1Y2CYA5_9FUNG|nr:Prefoldin subunit 6 [Rhizoclosmatium hyalinum]KAJ3281622.1 Prefoldin subunit 6 [Rhizoclosmatium sp. JEL0117]ORY52013.1 Prefoldin beta-like protein [Rhizoclosmatium globosum]|eukprot:ORY52013.1 Prefoldin beta-like protein [Rhizoclosmatium globosum]